MEEDIKFVFTSRSSQEIDDIVQEKLKDLERKLRSNGLNPNLCDWDKIEKKIRDDLVHSAWEKVSTAMEPIKEMSVKRAKYDGFDRNPFLWDRKIYEKENLVLHMAEKDFEAKYMCVWKFKVENIIFNDPATILFMNGKKFVSKCHDEPFNETKGLLMCLAKAYGYTHSKIKAKLKRRGLKDSQDAELCLLYDIAEKNGYSESEIDKLAEQYKTKTKKEK